MLAAAPVVVEVLARAFEDVASGCLGKVDLCVVANSGVRKGFHIESHRYADQIPTCGKPSGIYFNVSTPIATINDITYAVSLELSQLVLQEHRPLLSVPFG
ncbi:MAG: hypothetical protein J3R72DRAFT_473000 [Linnemannia gamsii]|nr:MAG: hypothetical protein J3R72DRAFT_473000 [Linnemannia gamsii]